MTLEVSFKDINRIEIRKKELKEIIEFIIVREGFLANNISIIFTTDKNLLVINSKYLNHQDYTDIIAFADKGKEGVSGELYISLERVKVNSVKFSKAKLYLELYRVIIHGILHLVGYNDFTGKERMQMTRMEDYYLNELNLQIGGIG